MPHGNQIYATSSDMEKATMCEQSQLDHALLHWKYALRCCIKCPCVNLTDQEKYDQYYETTPSN